MAGAYQPFVPARYPSGAPGDKPDSKPPYRVLVHRKFLSHWEDLVSRIGAEGARQFWDHVTQTPGEPCAVASTTILKGSAGKPIGVGWSRTCHYEISGAVRINYQFNNSYKTNDDGDSHRIVAIRTINYGSH